MTVLFGCENRGRPMLSSFDKQNFSLCLCKIQSMPQTLYKLSVKPSCKKIKLEVDVAVVFHVDFSLPPLGGGVRKGEVPQI